MTRLQKKIIREMIDTLRGTIHQIKAAIKEQDINKLQSVLSACQESAITIGEQIESLEGEGTATVSTLESYCEVIYETSVAADRGENIDNKLEELTGCLDKAISCVDETAVTSTVVFLPIDAKWWDGFETVWRKEISTLGTTVKVVPIPRYEVRYETGERVRHYDLDAYPEEIRAADCDSVDLKALHPDVIYIQDATDGTDFARKTDEKFYSYRLKDCTDDLVYIPYRIEIEPELRSREQLDKLSHNILVPGLDYADTVIVQSPNMRDAYINILKRRDKEYGITGGREWAEIIKGTGSPRAEKISSLKREDFEMPQEWLPFVKRADGSLKKIILYSNSVYTFMNSGMSIIDKLRDSFSIFRENSEDVALVWRPHPETREVISFLRPELLGAYDDIVREYRDEKLGILDDDEDFTRAIMLSDAFYGDDSALITIYKATGKPIMIENIDIRSQ